MTRIERFTFGHDDMRFQGYATLDESRVCYDLGIAHLVMGLAAEALAFLTHAAADPAWLPVSSAVLGGYFLDRGEPERAADWFRRGLAAPALDHEAWVELSRGLNLAQRCTPPAPGLPANRRLAA